MKCHPKLILGTVQLGMHYGIRPGEYKPPVKQEMASILSDAADAGIAGLDTAFEYGLSEEMIGELKPADWTPRIVTKTPKLRAGNLFPSTARLVKAAYEISCELLRVESCDTLMIHDSDLLDQPGSSHVCDVLTELKQSGAISKIGISIYNASQLEAASGKLDFDVVQLPLSLVDQRLLLDGTVSQLASTGIEVHVRSAFLQGALLMRPGEVPSGMEGLIPAIEELNAKARDADCTPLHALLRFALDLKDVSAVVCGVNMASQLRELCELSVADLAIRFDTSPLPISDETLLNPATWSTRIKI